MLLSKLNSYYRKIAIKFVILYLLNISDLFFTKRLLATGYFEEANPVTNAFIDQNFLVVIIKIVLVAILCVYMIIRMRKANLRQLRTSNIVMNIAVGCYCLVNISHLFWSVKVF
jgi:hypothetical protein